MGKLLHNMDIQLCCFLAGIYVYNYVCINWLPEKINVFQKFKSSNAFYARAQQMMLVTKRPVALHRWLSTGASREAASINISVDFTHRFLQLSHEQNPSVLLA